MNIESGSVNGVVGVVGDCMGESSRLARAESLLLYVLLITSLSYMFGAVEAHLALGWFW